jgi:hypothetical protein
MVGCHASVTVVVEKRWKTANKGEKGREVGSRASSQLLDSPRKTPAPVNCYKFALRAVNRRVEGPALMISRQRFEKRSDSREPLPDHANLCFVRNRRRLDPVELEFFP